MHLIRHSLHFASWKDRKALTAALKPIYTATSADAAQAELEAFEAGAWGQRFPTVTATWRRAWDRVIPFFAFSPAVRRVIYTTNAIESIHSRLRKIIKTRGHVPSDEAATKLIWLALRKITTDWSRAAKEWKEAMNQFATAYGERFTRPAAYYAARARLNWRAQYGTWNTKIQTVPAGRRYHGRRHLPSGGHQKAITPLNQKAWPSARLRTRCSASYLAVRNQPLPLS